MAERDEIRTETSAGSGHAPAFFDRGDRRIHLEKLRHLSQWSRRVLLVTGPRGVGKSTLYRQLSATLEPRAKAARISGSLTSGALEVLHAMVQGFGLAAASDAGAGLLCQVIGDHAAEQAGADRFCVAIVDDAELLEPRALESLIDLTARSPLRLVLFGEVRLVPAVERLSETRSVDWHEIRLTGFGVDDVRAYVEWRLRQQGHAGPGPFTDAQIREIARLSEGLPGRIDQMTNVLLARIRSAGHGPAGRRFPSLNLPSLHRGLLAVLLVLLVFAWLLWQPADTPDAARDTETVALPRPAEEELARAEEASSQRPPDGRSAGADAQAADEPDAAPETADTTAGGEDTVEEPSPVPPESASEPAEAPAEAPAQEPAAQAPGAADTVAETDAGADSEAPAQAATQAADPDAPRSAATEADSAAPAADAPVDEPAVAAAADTAGARDAAWILRQPASAYTLQLVSFSTAERADEYLGQQPEVERFARFRLQRDGRILHVVVYGRFDSPAEAAAAGEALPDSIGGVEPWVRSFGQVQQAVRTALQ